MKLPGRTRTGGAPSRGRVLAVLAAASALFALTGLCAAAVRLAGQLLDERRELLAQGVEAELASSVSAVAALVNGRAADIRSDLVVAADVLRQTDRRGIDEAFLSSSLAALARANRHYVGLYFVRGSSIAASVPAHRQQIHPVIDPDAIRELGRAAAAKAGIITSRTIAAPVSSRHTRLRLFAMSPRDGGDIGTVVFLVSMDTLFDSLQRRARMPGTDLWVVDRDGGLLVDPGTDDSRASILRFLTSGVSDGTAILGALPSLLPFELKKRSPAARMVAWQRTRGRALQWTTGVVAPLTSVRADLLELGGRLTAVVGLLVSGALAVALLIAGVVLRNRRLQDRVENLAVVQGLRDQLIRTEKLSTFGQLAAGVAHDVGTPLAAISIRIDQMLEARPESRPSAGPDVSRVPDPSGDRRRLLIMKGQVERISRIIRQLLDYARPHLSHHEAAVNLRSATESVAALIEHRLAKHGLKLDVDVPNEVQVRADVDQLQQVLMNLLVNACDACEDRSAGAEPGRIKVECVVSEQSDFVRICVIDNGSGIATEALQHVFEPFHTTKAPGGGTGLGLSIVNDITTRHGGSVSARCEEGRTTIELFWPTDGRSPSHARTPTVPAQERA